jgi:aryl-alcohol dehydrogenase-like predicted oxidoreductase
MTATRAPIDPGPVAVGTWSGGRFMHFGQSLDDERFLNLIRPDEAIRTVITADVYGAGEADTMLGRALAGRDRDEICVVGAVGHDFYEGERNGPKGFPRFTDPALRGPDGYADYLRMATERSLERCGVDSFDLLLLHNPDRTGYTSEAVWNGMAGLREAGLTRLIGVAPGPANGFTLDLIDCLERFGAVIDRAMIILGPLEPWPGELVLDAAADHDVEVITRVVDYGGLFFDDLEPGSELVPGDHRGFRPAGWIEAGRERLDAMRPVAQRTGLSMIQLACQWNLAHEAVSCVVPTLIQELGPHARRVEDKRAEMAALPSELRLSPADVEEIRARGDNSGRMALKGASPEHEGAELADRWGLDERLFRVADRWSIDPTRDLAQQVTA